MPTQENQMLARSIADAFGGVPAVQSFYDDGKSHEIDIIKCQNDPDNGLSSYSTIGLSDVEIFNIERQKLDFGVKLIGICESEAELFMNIVSTCAFNIIKDKYGVYPGVIHPNVFRMYDGLSNTLDHAMLVDPFIWESAFQSRELETKTVAFLQIIGTSELESDFAKENGTDELEDLFEQSGIDILT
ncbi:suppressor of fused domain protein [Lentilitoribacter sp. EG35]|uniref:suppressor of fused domain protein n=1 Tax=Lentilitoribacter sp. EG35 TaxID=3234192 RepID=UPI00345FD9B7